MLTQQIVQPLLPIFFRAFQVSLADLHSTLQCSAAYFDTEFLRVDDVAIWRYHSAQQNGAVGVALDLMKQAKELCSWLCKSSVRAGKMLQTGAD